MLIPLLTALGAVGVGLALGLATDARWLGPARIVAAIAAAAAVVFQLAPEAAHDLGWVALLLVAGAAAFPFFVDAVGRGLGGGRPALGVAYAGVLLHQLADGLTLGSLASVHHDHGHEVSYVALAAHTVALAALFTLLVRERAGRGAALLAGSGLGGALLGGALTVGWLPIAWIEALHPWVVAVAAGVLLHVALHPLVGAIGAARAAAVVAPTARR